MKLLLDINVVLDVILERKPWSVEAAKLFDAVEAGQATAFVAGHTVTTAHYFFREALGGVDAAAAVAEMLRVWNGPSRKPTFSTPRPWERVISRMPCRWSAR